jgi:hypothetical protein
MATQTLQKTSTNGTRDRGKNDPLADLINSLISCMKADFGGRFVARFPEPEDLRQFKRRLYSKLRGHSIDRILAGYERYVEQNPTPTFPPTVPELIASTRGVPVIEPVKQIERQPDKKPDEVIDCKTIANDQFNAFVASIGKPELKVADSYLKSEIDAMRPGAKQQRKTIEREATAR